MNEFENWVDEKRCEEEEYWNNKAL
jgi:hypothetical protein